MVILVIVSSVELEARSEEIIEKRYKHLTIKRSCLKSA